jgi:hypothetical protein
MYGIDRAGQKVICVIDHSLWADFCCDVQSWPLQDEIYTVSGFGEIENEPGVFLTSYRASPALAPSLVVRRGRWRYSGQSIRRAPTLVYSHGSSIGYLFL